MDTNDSRASLSFEPVNTTLSLGDFGEIYVNIFTENQSVISTDIWITYDPAIIQPILPAKGNKLFESTEARIVSPGKLYVYGIRRDTMTAGSANGAITSLKFKALKEGSTKLTFECPTLGTTRSQIIKNDKELSNIIDCARTVSHTSTVSVVEKTNILGAYDQEGGAPMMLYLTLTTALLIFFTLFFLRTKKLAKDETNIRV